MPPGEERLEGPLRAQLMECLKILSGAEETGAHVMRGCQQLSCGPSAVDQVVS